MVASLSAVRCGALYYRNLEIDKTIALKASKDDFDSMMSIFPAEIHELKWWINNLDGSFGHTTKPPIDLVIHSDASLIGRGAALGSQKTGGNLSADESTSHINVLKLKAVLFALKSFATQIVKKHVKLMIDNGAAVYKINNMGSSHTAAGNPEVVEIWEFCNAKLKRITATHIPRTLNVVADHKSRRSYKHSVWMPNTSLLRHGLSTLAFKPEIDLFTSRLNKQFSKYFSYRPDLTASHVNAFTIPWNSLKFYCFPPFSCILQLLQKITDKAEGVILVPNWRTQAWYPILKRLLIKPPTMLPPSKQMLLLPAVSESGTKNVLCPVRNRNSRAIPICS